MDTAIRDVWYEIGDSRIYTTGPYLIAKIEIDIILQDTIYGYQQKAVNAYQKKSIVTHLRADKDVSLFFMSFAGGGNYIMEVNVPSTIINMIDSLLPESIQNVLTDRKPILIYQ